MSINKMTSRQILIFQFFAIFFFSCNVKNNDAKKEGVKDSLANKETVNPYATHDQSPLDMSYCPKDYPVFRMNGADSSLLVARIIYSRPQKKGRSIFGGSERNLVPYGKEWRLGANEATEIQFFKAVKIGKQKIDKGSYIIYAIPYQDKWTIILNSNLYTWGLHMDSRKDVFKIDVPTADQVPILEDFTIVFEPSDSGASMIMAWDKVRAALPIIFLK
ncbi:MAG: DUF2911 domain-containing protein [Ferruginibacter sp.]